MKRRCVYINPHIDDYDSEALRYKTLDLKKLLVRFQTLEDALKNLIDGIIRIGAEVKDATSLVGKVTPKGLTEQSPEERLRTQSSVKAREVRDTSLRVPRRWRYCP